MTQYWLRSTLDTLLASKINLTATDNTDLIETSSELHALNGIPHHECMGSVSLSSINTLKLVVKSGNL